MPRLINVTAARKLAGNLPIHLGSTGIEALNQRIEQIIRHAGVIFHPGFSPFLQMNISSSLKSEIKG